MLVLARCSDEGFEFVSVEAASSEEAGVEGTRAEINTLKMDRELDSMCQNRQQKTPAPCQASGVCEQMS